MLLDRIIRLFRFMFRINQRRGKPLTFQFLNEKWFSYNDEVQVEPIAKNETRIIMKLSTHDGKPVICFADFYLRDGQMIFEQAFKTSLTKTQARQFYEWQSKNIPITEDQLLQLAGKGQRLKEQQLFADQEGKEPLN